MLYGLLICATIGIVIYLGAQGGDIGAAWEAMITADPVWLLAGFGAWGVFAVFEALVLQVFFWQQKVKVKFGSTLLVSLIGMFYSSITPAATGGQPMQVFALKKRGVSSGISSSGLAVKFFTWQFALLVIGGFFWFTKPQLIDSCIGTGRWFVLTGFLVNGVSVVAVLLLAVSKNIVRVIITLLLRLGKALHIIKDLAKSTSKADAALQDFRASVDMLTQHPFQLLTLILVSFIQVMGLMSVAFCVYKALGQTGYGYTDLAALQCLLYIAASFTPLPGASGAQEGGFYLFFQQVFPAGTLLGALLLWRFITYYFTIIVSLTAVVVDSVRSMRKAALRPADDGAEGEQDIAQQEDRTEV